jgi:hypothetical protein
MPCRGDLRGEVGIDPTHVHRGRVGAEPRFDVNLWRLGYGHGWTSHNPSRRPVSLWTPGGEHRPEPPEGGGADATPEQPPLSADEQAQLEAMQAEMAEVRQQLLEAPASVVVANHAMGIYELAAIHLTATEPKLAEAVLAIDALAALVEGLEGRLGDAEPTLREALGQLRAAYLEVRGRVGG